MRASKSNGQTRGHGGLSSWQGGRVILKLMPIDWEQKGPGMAELIQDLPELLKQVLPAGKKTPKAVVTDRGPGFYQASSGTIAAAYKEALADHGFAAFASDEAAWQPPDIPDVLLHETVVAWGRAFFKQHPFKLVPKVQENLTGGRSRSVGRTPTAVAMWKGCASHFQEGSMN